MIPIHAAADIGETLGLLRQLARLTQRDLAARSGTTQTQISLWELGLQVPGPANLIRLLAALGHGMAFVPLDETAPQTAPASTLAAEPPSAGVLGRPEGQEIAHGASEAVDSCTCGGYLQADPDCPVHHGRRARGPKPPPVGPGCNCDGSGRTCPRHGVVI